MKKVFFLFLLSAFFVEMSAQETRLGITAGVNISSPSELNSKAGFHAGVKAEHAFADRLYASLGLLLTSKGWKTATYYDIAEQRTFQSEATPYYLEMPVHVGYKVAVGRGVKVFADAGPYLGLGLFGSFKQVSTMNAVTTEVVCDNLFKEKKQKRFDWGLGLNAGVELAGRYQVSVGYDQGLTKMFKKDMRQDSKNGVFKLSLAYLF